MPSIRELRSAQRNTGNLYDTVFTRRISVYVTSVFLRLGIRPNAVSLSNMAIGLSAWVLIAMGTHVLVGVVLIHVYAVLDSVDGELARVTRRFSLQGLYLEDHSAYLMISGYWLAMGVYLANGIGSPWPLWCCVALVAFGRSGMPAARRGLLKSIKTHRPLADGELNLASTRRPTELSGLLRFVFVDVLHPANVWALSTTVLVLEHYFSDDHWFLIALTGTYFLLSIVRETSVFARFAFTGALDGELAALYDAAAHHPATEIDPFILAGDSPRKSEI